MTGRPDAAAAPIEADLARPVQESRQDRARREGYESRFTLIYVALAVIGAVGIGAFVMLLVRDDPPPPAKWSAWQPNGSDTAKVRQIADRVAKGYRLLGGDQLVAAIPSSPKVASADGTVPVDTIAIRPDTSTGKKEESEIEIVPTAHNLQFRLCGLGAGCSIGTETASEEREALLRREALELAAYTFKYVDGVDSVSVFLPPRPGASSSAVSVFLRKKDVSSLLHAPLRAAIGSKVPQIGFMPEREAAVVDRITQPRLYTYSYEQAQDGGAVLIYSPVVLGA